MVFFYWASKAILGDTDENMDAPAPDRREFVG
jgi:hypothetical protein